jgi:CarboxypepD_reg-like domain/TonB-dependent Receptor Plug Domain
MIFFMKNKALITLCLCLPILVFSQNITLSGYVRDAKTGESLIGATLFEATQKVGTTTNEYGYFSLSVSSYDTIGLVISFIGYQPQAKKIFTKENLRLDIDLADNTAALDEVVVNASRNDDNVQRAQMGVIDVPMRAILTLPVIGGERDILKIIQLLPGVQSGQEGTTGYFVRGGNLDQNLVQLDEATVYNPNHLFGLFSTFNVNAINHVKLIKGGFPSEFGGRLSSILDIQMKEGDKNHFHTEGGIGLLSDNLTVQAPIQKNKSSFIVSGRQTHVNLLLKALSDTSTTYKFYDFNAKMNYEFGEKDHLFISFFKGNDNAGYSAANSLKYTTDFGNTTGTLRWNHLFGSKIFSNTSLIYNDYHLALSTDQNSYYSALFTGIKDVTFKNDFTHIPNAKHRIKMGISYTYHTLYPAAFSANIPRRGNRISINKDSVEQFYSTEMALYAGDEFDVSKKFSLNYGVRVPAFIVSNKIYSYIEPRLTAKLSINPSTSLKASYTQMNQFLHLIPNTTAGLPTDIWLPSSTKTKPQYSAQYALGYFSNFNKNEIETSVEVYYKKMDNQVLFAEGNQLKLTTNLDSSLVYGKGESYGAEFFVKKNLGKLTGWISYTLSWTNQSFKDLNFGEKFPFKYDRRHVLSLTSSYELSPKWNLSAVFVYSSGVPFTLPAGRVAALNAGAIFEGNYFIYEGRNNFRLDSYHRLDVAATYHKPWKVFKKPCDIEWVFGIYNTYSRLNPYFVYFQIDPISNQPQAKQVSLLPIIPSISFNFKL